MHLFETVDTSSLIGFLVEITLKGTFVLAAAGLATAILRSTSAAVRHLIWSTALILLLALPAFVVFTPSYEVAVLPADLDEISLPVVSPPAAQPDVSVKPAEPAVASLQIGSASGSAALFRSDRERVSAGERARRTHRSVVRAADPPAPARRFAWHQALFALWIIGGVLVAIRYFLGWIALRRMQRQTVPVADVRFRLLVKRTAAGIGLRRRIRVIWGGRGAMPLTFGWFHPTVLLPEDAKEWDPERLLLVLRHELAHVKRCDCLIQAIVYIACTLYWFNPLVWLAATQSHREREMACDDYVLATGAPGHDYAGHLLEIARSLQGPRLSGLTTIAMARHTELEGRLMAILSTDRRRDGTTPRSVAATFGVLGCLVMTIAALRPVAVEARKAQEQIDEPKPVRAVESDRPVRSIAKSDMTRQGDTPSVSVSVSSSDYDAQYVAEASAIVERVAATLETSLKTLVPKSVMLTGSVVGNIDGAVHIIADGTLQTAQADTIPLEQIRRLRNAGVDADYIEKLASVGLDRLTVEQLISLAHAEVDAEYVLRLRRAGYENLSVDDLIDLGFAGVNAGTIEAWAEVGYKDLSSRDLIKLAHADVDVSFVRAMKEMGFNNLSASELIQFGNAGVDPKFIRSMREMGLENLSSRDLMRLSHADVDADFIRALGKAGYSNLSADDLIRLSHADVNPEFIRRMSQIGLTNLSPDELVELGHADVGADFVVSLKAAGYDHLTASELVDLAHADINASFIKEMGEAGLAGLNVEDLIKLGHADVDAEFIREMRKSGYANLTADELIQLGYAGVDPDYIADLGRAGLTNLSTMDLVQLSHADIDAGLIAELSNAGYKDISAGDLVQLGFAGVDADFISEMASVGLTRLSTSDLVMLAHAGVDAHDVRELRRLGVKTSDPTKIVQYKYMDIDPEYIERIQKAMDNAK